MRFEKVWRPWSNRRQLKVGDRVRLNGEVSNVKDFEASKREMVVRLADDRLIKPEQDKGLQVQIIEENAENDFDRLFWAYSQHDWSHDMSDDIDARRQGRAELSEIGGMERMADARTKLAALVWAYRMRAIPPTQFRIRRNLFIDQLPDPTN